MICALQEFNPEAEVLIYDANYDVVLPFENVGTGDPRAHQSNKLPRGTVILNG